MILWWYWKKVKTKLVLTSKTQKRNSTCMEAERAELEKGERKRKEKYNLIFTKGI